MPWFASPRFSNGWGDARHLPTILVEAHSLKPYRAARPRELRAPRKHAAHPRREGRRAAARDAGRSGPPPGGAGPRMEADPRPGAHAGASRRRVAQGPLRRLRGHAPRVHGKAAHRLPAEVRPDRGRGPRDPSPRLLGASGLGRRHRAAGAAGRAGREAGGARRPWTWRCTGSSSPKLASQPFEGRVTVAARFEVERRRETFAPGSVRVPTDQPLGDLVMLLLEPAAPDSFFSWGFFHEVLQPTEYVEAYVMEPMAERMLAEDPALKEAFEKKLREDPAFAGSRSREAERAGSLHARGPRAPPVVLREDAVLRRAGAALSRRPRDALKAERPRKRRAAPLVDGRTITSRPAPRGGPRRAVRHERPPALHARLLRAHGERHRPHAERGPELARRQRGPPPPRGRRRPDPRPEGRARDRARSPGRTRARRGRALGHDLPAPDRAEDHRPRPPASAPRHRGGGGLRPEPRPRGLDRRGRRDRAGRRRDHLPRAAPLPRGRPASPGRGRALVPRRSRLGAQPPAARERPRRGGDPAPEPRRPGARGLHPPGPEGRRGRDLPRLHLRLQLLLDHRDAGPQLPPLLLRAGARRHRGRPRPGRARHLHRGRQRHPRRRALRSTLPGPRGGGPERPDLHGAGHDLGYRQRAGDPGAPHAQGGLPVCLPRHRERAGGRPRVPEGQRQERRARARPPRGERHRQGLRAPARLWDLRGGRPHRRAIPTTRGRRSRPTSTSRRGTWTGRTSSTRHPTPPRP